MSGLLKPAEFPGLYRIASRAVLPIHMHGAFTFTDAYHLCCQWNRENCVRDMAWPEPEPPPESQNKDLVLRVQVAAREFRAGMIPREEFEEKLRAVEREASRRGTP